MIPRTFHRVWLDEPVPEQFEIFWDGFRKLHPDWEFKSWEASDELDWMQNREMFDSFTDYPAAYALRADIARYEILNRHGGVYIDTDMQALKAFDPLLAYDEPFVAWCSEKELDPATIGSPAGHPAMQYLVDQLAGVYKWTRQNKHLPVSPPGVTGPRFITERWRNRDDVRRLPPIFFFPHHWSSLRGKGGPYPAESYAVHHWNAGWK